MRRANSSWKCEWLFCITQHFLNLSYLTHNTDTVCVTAPVKEGFGKTACADWESVYSSNNLS